MTENNLVRFIQRDTETYKWWASTGLPIRVFVRAYRRQLEAIVTQKEGEGSNQ